ncbi:MAG TPA: GNAT family N-acetyltransferase [Myxococcota bacterium]|nr:GNAT family N-acetyltransferase [Myxococcota bacterium]
MAAKPPPLRPEDFWAERLGCAAAALVQPGFLRVPLPREAVFAVATRAAVVAAAPERLHARLRGASDPRALVTRAGLAELFPEAVRFVGPARVDYLHHQVSAPPGVVALEPRDARVAALRDAATGEEWQHADLFAAETPVFAVELEGALAAAAGFERLLGRVAHLRVLAHPRHRGRGAGRRVVQAAAARAQSLGLLPQYQTLAANAPSVAVAAALGFEAFATTLTAVLRSAHE